MSDPLSAYFAEVWAVEDAWFEERYSTPGYSAGGPDSLWERNWGLLREIGDRHGLRLDDPRAYSIAAFRAEMKAIDGDWDRHCREIDAIRRADPEADPPYGRAVYRHRARGIDCETRHFPGLNPVAPEATADSAPKVWRWISFSLGILDGLGLTDTGRSALLRVSREKVERSHSLLLAIGLPWVPDPSTFAPDLTVVRCRQQLLFYANRLEREEAAALPDDLIRRFAGTLSLHIPNRSSSAGPTLAAGQADRNGALEPATLNPPKGGMGHPGPGGMTKSRPPKEPPPEAFAAYRLYLEGGMDQATVAREIQEQIKRPVDQPKVSRWVALVKAWREAGNSLPDLQMINKMIKMDPRLVERGPRLR